MRETILNLLLACRGEYVSGEEVSRRLGISRAAVGKHVRALREARYRIESHPRRGHRLLAVPDLLYPQEIRRGLDLARLGRQIHHFSELDSTNDLALRLAEEGAPEGTLVVAEAQRRGRGRRGRPWVSPPRGGIWMSLILRPPLPPEAARGLTLLAAWAVAQAVRKHTGLESHAERPNDILIGERKAGGVLTEMRAEAEVIHYAVVGIGLNVDLVPENLPPEARPLATSLSRELGASLPRVPLAQTILRELESSYLSYLERRRGPARDARREEEAG